MRMVIEFCVFEPTRLNARRDDLWQGTTCCVQGVALFAGFRPEQPLCIVDAELNPLRGTPRDAWDSLPARYLAVRRFDLMDGPGIRGNISLELSDEEGVDHIRLVMRSLLIAEARIELQSVTSRALTGKLDRRHVRGANRRHQAGSFRFGGTYKLSGIRRWFFPCRAPVTILASHLHSCTVRAHQVRLHVKVVVQTNLARVANMLCEWRKLRMTLVKT